jgi:hypothetical protein
MFMSDADFVDDDMECVDESSDNVNSDVPLMDVQYNKSFRRRIEEHEESRWLRSALDDF